MRKCTVNSIKWNLTMAAREWGVTKETINKGLHRLDLEPDAQGRFTTKQIDSAIHGDLKAERTRLTKADADRRELEVRKLAGELVEFSQAEELVRSMLQPIRDRFVSAPASLAARCNPSDPEHARGELAKWVEDAMKLFSQ